MSHRVLRAKLLSAIIISCFLIGFIPQVAWAGETVESFEEISIEYKDEYDLDDVYILYDKNDETLTMIAEAVEEIASYKLMDVHTVEVDSYIDLTAELKGKAWVRIYALSSNLTHVIFSDHSISWHQFYKLLKETPESRHIVGMGNALSLDKFVLDNDESILASQSEQTDALLLIMDDLWALADVIEDRAAESREYKAAADHLRSMILTLYADSFNQMFERTLEPVDIVGQVDEEALADRTARMWEEHAPTIRPAAYRLLDDGSMVEVPEEELDDDFSPVIKLGQHPALADDGDDFSLGEIPLFSGLRGPIGEIINILLAILSDSGNTEVSIDGDVMETIKDIFEVIGPIIGIASNYDSSSPLKSVVQALANEFPFIEEYKVYIEVLLKCLFNLRGDTASIIGTVTEAVLSLLPEIFPGEISEFIVDLLGVDAGIGDVIADVVRDGKGVFDTLLGFFVNNVLAGLYNKTLVAVFDLDASITSILQPRLVSFTKSIINYLTTWDFERFITDVGVDLLTATLGVLSEEEEDYVAWMMAVFKLVFTIIDMIDEWSADSVVEVVAQLAITIFGESELTVSGEDFAHGVLDVVKIYKEGEGEEFSNVTTFEDQVSSFVDSSVTGQVNDSLIELVVDTVTMVGGFFNDGFDENDIPSAFQILAGFAAEILPPAVLDDMLDILETVIKPSLGIIAAVTDSDPLRRIVSQTLGNFESEIGAIPGLIVQVLYGIGLGDYIANTTENDNILIDLAQIAYGIIKIVESADGKSYQGVMQGILISAGAVVGVYPAFDDVPIKAFVDLLQAFFPDMFGIPRDERPRRSEVIAEIIALAAGELGLGFDIDMLSEFLEVIMDTKDIFTKGVRWLVGMLFDWLTGELTPLLDDLVTEIEEALGGAGELVGYHNVLPIGLGDWNLFDLTIDLGLIATFNIDPQPLFDLISSLIFDARKTLSLDTLEDFFLILFKCISISPQFYAELGVEDFDTSKNPLFAFLLSSFGLELTFSGSAHFILNLFTFRGGIFEWEDFMKVIEWGFNIKITVSRTFTFLDFVTGGAGGALNVIAEYIGLDAITVTVFFGVELDIVKRAATAVAPEVSQLTLAISIGAMVHIGISIIIAEIAIDGILEITLTFIQDLAGGSPLVITLGLVMTIKIIVDLALISKDWKFDILDKLWDISPNKGDSEYENSGIGFDADGDGLGDEYESTLPGLDLNNPDTDGDGANDKLEVQTMYTDATIPDTDFDGLLDGEEWELGTNPHQPDTDWDGVPDFDEVRVFETNPLTQDTDGDGLTDEYEIYTSWNISTVTPTVTEVVIGGESFNDHTDPLNPDTDGDGLMDGDEGPMGAYYGLPSLYNETTGSGMDPNPVIFNDGYTHPLDADTDDDSYLQLYNGVIDSQALLFLKDMNDGNEVNGFWTIFYDEDGIPEERLVFTNPVNPDSDGDTGVTDRTPQAGMWLNSDGYELAQDPPTDPNNADSDGDGLIDGIEGVLNPLSNHTNPNVADTDADGLYDMQEILLGCDPRSPDTDGDLITDGNEFYVFFTNPLVDDSDFDALKDGEEVYLWHSNPLLDDSDGDTLPDGREVLLYGSDPMDEDTDNDGLTDFEEVWVYYTDTFEYDTDQDGLSDGDEIHLYDTDPLNWDTDGDSITEPNQFGEYTWPMSDYDEVMIHGTNATDPDSDMDGLSDGIELYLASGLIPWTDPINLDPMSEDTDGDLLIDGNELMLVNVSDIIYPFRALTFIFRYHTDPCNNDTDGDLLTDFQEVVVFNSDANNTDTDNDTLDDWNEIWRYNTSALTNDTDGDGLWDFEETVYDVWPYGSWPPSNWSIGKYRALADMNPSRVYLPSQTYGTSATDPDSDDDYLPDGSEIFLYITDPLDDDSDNDGTMDTYEFDTDVDGLEDGMEFMLGTVYLVGGGIYSPDSDRDGLLDGDEYYIYGSSPTDSDTDGDGYSDGFEVAMGSSPSAFSYFAVVSPHDGTIVPENTMVRVLNYTAMDAVWYRYRTDDTWSSDASLTYDAVLHSWVDPTAVWAPGSYEMQVFGEDTNGTIHEYEVAFIVEVAAAEPSAIQILTPLRGTTVYHDTDIRVVNMTTFDEMWFRHQTTSSWSDNGTLSYDSEAMVWYNDTVLWEPGNHTLQVFGRTIGGQVVMAQASFVVIPVPTDFTLFIILGLAAALAVVTFGLLWTTGTLTKIKNRIRPSDDTTEEVAAEEVPSPPDEEEETTPTKKKSRKKTSKKKSTKSKSRRKKKTGTKTKKRKGGKKK